MRQADKELKERRESAKASTEKPKQAPKKEVVKVAKVASKSSLSSHGKQLNPAPAMVQAPPEVTVTKAKIIPTRTANGGVKITTVVIDMAEREREALARQQSRRWDWRTKQYVSV